MLRFGHDRSPDGKTADLLIDYSCAVQPGERVLIEAIDVPPAFTKALIRSTAAAGGRPMVWLKSNEIQLQALDAGRHARAMGDDRRDRAHADGEFRLLHRRSGDSECLRDGGDDARRQAQSSTSRRFWKPRSSGHLRGIRAKRVGAFFAGPARRWRRWPR